MYGDARRRVRRGENLSPSTRPCARSGPRAPLVRPSTVLAWRLLAQPTEHLQPSPQMSPQPARLLLRSQHRRAIHRAAGMPCSSAGYRPVFRPLSRKRAVHRKRAGNRPEAPSRYDALAADRHSSRDHRVIVHLGGSRWKKNASGTNANGYAAQSLTIVTCGTRSTIAASSGSPGVPARRAKAGDERKCASVHRMRT